MSPSSVRVTSYIRSPLQDQSTPDLDRSEWRGAWSGVRVGLRAANRPSVAHRAEGALAQHPVVPVGPLAHAQLRQVHLAGVQVVQPPGALPQDHRGTRSIQVFLKFVDELVCRKHDRIVVSALGFL